MDTIFHFITIVAWIVSIPSSVLLVLIVYAIIKNDLMGVQADAAFLQSISARRRVNWTKPVAILIVVVVSWAWIAAV